MKNNLDKSELVILDVFEMVDYKPVFKYKINVLDKFVILVSNNDVPQTGVSKCINKQVNERLILYELTDDDKSVLGIPLTHKFHLKQFSNQYLFLNLTNRDLINLGFKESKINIRTWLTFIKKFHKTLVWVLAGILMLLSIIVAGLEIYDHLNKQSNPKESNQPINKQNIDDDNVSKTDSLTKK